MLTPLDSDAAKIPKTAATTEASIQFPAARTFGENPNNVAPFSSSAAALVANPNVVALYRMLRSKAVRITIPASQKRSWGIRVPSIVSVSVGRIALTVSLEVPNRSRTRDCSRIKTPTVATTFASSGAPRKGRKTSK